MSDERRSVRLLLVRHGRVDAGAPLDADTPLDEVGRAQAEQAGAALSSGLTRVTRVFSSPFRRAFDTAEVVAASIGLDAEVEPLLREFELGGEGVTSYEQAQADRPDLAFWRAEHRSGPDAESLGEFQARVTALLTVMASRALPDDAYVLVTHAGVIDAALRWTFGLTSTMGWMVEAMAPHGSVTEIEHWPRGRHELGAPRYSALHRLGDVSWLPPELRSD